MNKYLLFFIITGVLLLGISINFIWGKVLDNIPPKQELIYLNNPESWLSLRVFYKDDRVIELRNYKGRWFDTQNVIGFHLNYKGKDAGKQLVNVLGDFK